MSTDAELLRLYAEAHDESAFRELVRRHLDLIFSVALRQVGGDAHLAQDVCQQVFVDLARKSHQLANRPVLMGWLYRSTQFAASSLVRRERARRAREIRAQFMYELPDETGTSVNWDKVRPLLDEAVGALPDIDRDAILLRFLESRSFEEIGTALRLSEDAARMRVSRALQKLRGSLARRGVSSTTAALGLAFANQASHAAPAGLAASIAGAALAASTGGGLASGVATIFMSTKTVLVVSVVALVAVGSACYETNQAHRANAEIARLVRESGDFRTQALSDRRRAAQDLSNVQAENQILKSKARVDPLASQAASKSTPIHSSTIGLPRWQIQKNVLNSLRLLDKARKAFKEQHGVAANSVYDLVGPDGLIRILHSVDGEDYSKLSTNPDEPMSVNTAGGLLITLDPSGANTTAPQLPPEAVHFEELAARIGPSINDAVNAYRASHAGSNPTEQNQLIPFFATPQQGADFVEFLVAQKAAGL